MSETRKLPCGNCKEYVLEGGMSYGSCSCESCPYCDKLISRYSFEEDVTDEGENSIWCPSCEKEISYYVEYRINISIQEKE